MPATVTLRPWQKAALDRIEASSSPDFLAVATPGAGKTTFALTAARRALAADPRRRVLVVVPTAHLKAQWATAADALDLHLDPRWSAADGALPGDMHGVVATYQQVAGCAPALRAMAGGAFAVFDEVHHAADDRAWGDAVRVAFEPAARRLALSGTPFRSDTQAIPFVRYHLDEAVPDYEYGYGQALAEGGVVRPVYFPRVDGLMEWSAPDGSLHAHSFEDDLGAALSGQRLRTAYSLEGEWLPHVLGQAHGRLLAIRERQPAAGGLVIATDVDHAKGIARLLRDRVGARAAVVTSDDPDASARISRFAAGTEPWIVAVRMVSEGVDIPRLRVGVFATTITTELFFRQAVGRLVRWTRGAGRQKSFLYIPDEPRLRARAFAIAEQRRHSLRRDASDDGLALDGDGGAEPDEAQPSLFAAISAVPLGGDVPEWVLDDEAADDPVAGDDLTVPLPPIAARGPGGPGGRTRREHKEHLRLANAAKSRLIARHTGMTHAKVNAELNRVAGLRRISEATVDQLEKRLRTAEAWLLQASARRTGG
ncbi:MAG TPA: DEAD/DEAH box helicase [Acidimicrobiales bacterium]|nr:DEAD/DEAH box helicase [Acidimicrobiales bacterium]